MFKKIKVFHYTEKDCSLSQTLSHRATEDKRRNGGKLGQKSNYMHGKLVEQSATTTGESFGCYRTV